MTYILHVVMAQNLGPILLSPHLILTLLLHSFQPILLASLLTLNH